MGAAGAIHWHFRRGRTADPVREFPDAALRFSCSETSIRCGPFPGRFVLRGTIGSLAETGNPAWSK